MCSNRECKAKRNEFKDLTLKAAEAQLERCEKCCFKQKKRRSKR